MEVSLEVFIGAHNCPRDALGENRGSTVCSGVGRGVLDKQQRATRFEGKLAVKGCLSRRVETGNAIGCFSLHDRRFRSASFLVRRLQLETRNSGSGTTSVLTFV